jgi:hypothetical protein
MIFVQTIAHLFVHLVLHSSCQRTLPARPPHYLTLDLIMLRGEWRGHIQIYSKQSEQAHQEFMRCSFCFGTHIFKTCCRQRAHISASHTPPSPPHTLVSATPRLRYAARSVSFYQYLVVSSVPPLYLLISNGFLAFEKCIRIVHTSFLAHLLCIWLLKICLPLIPAYFRRPL